MQITGEMLIGSKAVRGREGVVRVTNPATGLEMEPLFHGGSRADVHAACELAEAAFDVYRGLPLETRAAFLETIAQGIIELGDVLIERVMQESGLPRARVEGERGRTAGQLRLFASLVRDGRWLNATIDRALPERKPLPRADLRSQRIPLGPVAVFGASNFPLAFSVAGGDTASALAAGCPVIAKSHPSHLGTSELVGRVIQKAVSACGLPEGVFSLLLDGPNHIVGQELVLHPLIQAVGFTGSRRVGRTLVSLAAGREQPIPVYAEMSSVNPVFLLPSALATDAEGIARGYVDSFTLGTGQFCTKPGLAIGVAGPDFDRFRTATQSAVAGKAAATMLNAGIRSAYKDGIAGWRSNPQMQPLASQDETEPVGCTGQPMLFEAQAESFLGTSDLLEEIFGPVSLLIVCRDTEQMMAVAKHLNGQLTATIHMGEEDMELARLLVPHLERKAGRILFNGFPTGVEVTHAMVHGGPHPATSDSRVTSVGSMAIDRFLRPVCYQDFPSALLPEALQDDGQKPIWRTVEGKPQLS